MLSCLPSVGYGMPPQHCVEPLVTSQNCRHRHYRDERGPVFHGRVRQDGTPQPQPGQLPRMHTLPRSTYLRCLPVRSPSWLHRACKLIRVVRTVVDQMRIHDLSESLQSRMQQVTLLSPCPVGLSGNHGWGRGVPRRGGRPRAPAPARADAEPALPGLLPLRGGQAVPRSVVDFLR